MRPCHLLALSPDRDMYPHVSPSGQPGDSHVDREAQGRHPRTTESRSWDTGCEDEMVASLDLELPPFSWVILGQGSSLSFIGLA